jgi:hypothetical protein
MQDSGIPAKFPIPWANSAGSGFIRTVPQASQIGHQNGAASLTDGFPPNCFIPIAGGGSWPWGQDFNGILNLITKWQQWNQAGGPISYDATFQTAIGGYPKGALVQSAAAPGVLWQSTVDNNTTNPDAAGAGWTVLTLVDPNTAGLIISGSGTSGAGLRFVGNGTTTPFKTIRTMSGVLQVINSAYTTAILQLDDLGNLSDIHNVTASGAISAGAGVSAGGDVNAGGNVSAANVVSAGNALQAGSSMSPTAANGHEWVFYDNPTGHIQQFRSGWYDLWETATGVRRWASPNGYMMTLDGAGNLSCNGAFNASGNVTASGGRLRASFGATASGDGNAATLLADFPMIYLGGNNWYTKLPNGLITIMWYDAIDGQSFNVVKNYPVAFPSACIGVNVQVGYIIASSENAVFGATPISNAQYGITNAGQVSSGAYGYFAIAYGY